MPVDKNLLHDLKARGLVFQSTDEKALNEHLQQSRVIYAGFDPTADSLHLGNLMVLMFLRRFQLAGHKTIALVGGATGLIGDPGGRTEERQLNSADVVENWTNKIKSQVSRFIDFDCGENSAIVVNNLDWAGPMTMIPFLRDVGKHFSVNAMIKKDSVKTRLERDEVGISYTEFSYMILQALDYHHLHEQYGCTVQLGGSDQWGNITAGVDLVRRLDENEETKHVHALSLPLLTKADGTKYGKTAGGAIWLDAERTSPYAFYQFCLNIPDEDVEKFLNFFSFKPLTEITEIVAAHKADPGQRLGQRTVAQELTALVHGAEAVTAAEHITAVVFAREDDKWSRLSEADFKQLAQGGLPSSATAEPQLQILAALSQTELATSNRQAREFIDAGSVKVNGQLVPKGSYDLRVLAADAFYGKFTVLQVGKKKVHILAWPAAARRSA